jgi:Domain of Unknown Function (DUF928)
MIKNVVKPLRFLLIGLALSFGSTIGVVAQPPSSQSFTPTASLKEKPQPSPPQTVLRRRTRVVFNPPKGGAPLRTRSGASRGDVCFQPGVSSGEQFMAIAPTSTEGLTASSHPTFFVYLPPTSAKQAIFSLRDEESKVVYQMPISLQNVQHRMLSVQLPKTAPGLAVGVRYRWMVAVLCSEKLEPSSPIASSWVRRINLPAPLSKEFRSQSSLEQAAFYGAQGLWYDMIAALVHQRQLHPNDAELESNWQEILTTVGLDEIAKASVSVQ